MQKQSRLRDFDPSQIVNNQTMAKELWGTVMQGLCLHMDSLEEYHRKKTLVVWRTLLTLERCKNSGGGNVAATLVAGQREALCIIHAKNSGLPKIADFSKKNAKIFSAY